MDAENTEVKDKGEPADGVCPRGQDQVLADIVDKPSAKPVGILDIPRVYFAPRSLFSRVEDVKAYGWTFVLLLAAVTLIGYATVETGLIDRQVDIQIDKRIADLEKQQADVVERSQLRKEMEDIRKGGDFLRLMRRLQVMIAEPVKVLAACLLIAAVLYGTVALTGRKPEWHTLLTICVYASFIDVLRLLFRLALMLRYGQLEVDTSLGVLAALLPADAAKGVSESAVASASAFNDPEQLRALVGHVLSGFDPFAIWFWIVVFIGVRATAQLRGWKSWVSCTL
ncbi:MAG: YIP1 family protein, partial [Phycisphaerales bacterium]